MKHWISRRLQMTAQIIDFLPHSLNPAMECNWVCTVSSALGKPFWWATKFFEKENTMDEFDETEPARIGETSEWD